MLRRYVVTGAPGSGKTCLRRELRARGHAVVEEAATDVSAEQQALGIDEPWARDDLVDLTVMLQRERASVPVDNSLQVQIHDRSPLCTLALAGYLGRPVTPLLAGQASRMLSQDVHARSALFVCPLGFIEPTAARRISYAESLAFERVHEDVYREHGFDLVDIPPGPLTDRADLAEVHILAATQPLRHR